MPPTLFLPQMERCRCSIGRKSQRLADVILFREEPAEGLAPRVWEGSCRESAVSQLGASLPDEHKRSCGEVPTIGILERCRRVQAGFPTTRSTPEFDRGAGLISSARIAGMTAYL